MMSSANFLFVYMMFLGTLVSVSASNWVICWIGVEISFLGLIPMLSSGNKFVSLNKESSLKYFCIQALGSALLFLSGLLYYSGFLFHGGTYLAMIVSLCLKLGMFPGHFWVPAVISGLEWFPMFLILTIQKVPPFVLLVLILSGLPNSYHEICLFLGGASSIAGGFLGNNQTDIRAVIGASSVSHSGWMMLSAMSGSFYVYFSLYCLVLGIVLMSLKGTISAASGLGFLSMSGLPPFLMFVGKWAVFSSCIEAGIPAIFLGLFIAGALFSLIFYLKFMYSLYLYEMGSSVNSVPPRGALLLIVVNMIGILFLVMF